MVGSAEDGAVLTFSVDEVAKSRAGRMMLPVLERLGLSDEDRRVSSVGSSGSYRRRFRRERESITCVDFCQRTHAVSVFKTVTGFVVYISCGVEQDCILTRTTNVVRFSCSVCC